jgi:ATP/maltotriose-dependent transcriptional regulator MalT
MRLSSCKGPRATARCNAGQIYAGHVSAGGTFESGDPRGGAFVGRASEIASLASCAALSQAGKAQVAWIEGEAGCGKTGLVNHWLRGISGEFQVIRAEADELTRDLTLNLAGQLGSFVATDGFGVGMEILDLIDTTQTDGPVALVVEDLHWGDLASRQAFLTAARRLRNDRSMMVLTSRPVSRDDGWDRFTSDPERCVRINLGALSIQEVGELARRCGTPLSRQSAARLHRHTLGHALYVRTLLSELSTEQLVSSEAGLPAPRSLASTTVARLADTTTDAQILASAMAVLNHRVPLKVAARVAGVEESTRALESLLETGFVKWWPGEVGTPIEYAHPLYRAAIYDDLSPSLRHDLHVAAANVLDHPDALMHRVAASDPSDHELVEELVKEARSKEERNELGLAAKYWLWVSSLSQVRDQSELALLQGARLLIADGQFHRAAALQAQIEATASSPFRSLLLGAIAWKGGDALHAERWFDEVLTLANVDPSQAPLRIEGLVRLATLFVIQNRGSEAFDAAQQALNLGPADQSLEIRAWSELVRADGQLRGAASGLDLLAGRLLGNGSRIKAPEVDLLLTRGILGFYGGRNVKATADFRNVIRLVRQGAQTAELPRAHLQLAQLLIIGGEWDDAVLHARLGLSLVDDGGQVWIEAQAHAALSSVMASRGQWTEAVAHAKSARAVADMLGTIEALFTAHIAESALARARGESDAVVASLAPLVGTGDSTKMTMLTSLGWWPVLIHALIDQGDLVSANRQLEQLRIAAFDRSIDVEARTASLQARLTLAGGDPDGATVEFTRSLELFGADDAILDRAAVHHYFGRLLHARGKRQLAVTQYRSAHDLYGSVGAEPYLGRVELDLRDSGVLQKAGPGPAGLSLTERERDVATLVARGMTNRQVAAELYVSSKAVEYHLRNIFGKLGVSSRSELRASLFS